MVAQAIKWKRGFLVLSLQSRKSQMLLQMMEQHLILRLYRQESKTRETIKSMKGCTLSYNDKLIHD
jgi:hypothetical protein